MRIGLATEGTYPYTHGGVSVWCDQIVRGMPEHDFHLVAITADGTERLAWDLPRNVGGLTRVPLWAASSAAPAPSRPAEDLSGEIVSRFLQALVAEDLSVARPAFRAALDAWSRWAGDRRLEAALTGQEAVEELLDRWSSTALAAHWGGPLRHGLPTVGDAVTATRLIAHSLRPLAVDPPRVDVVHLVANGIAGLIGLSAKWRHGTPYVLSEHGVYIRERYLAYRGSGYSWPVKWLMLRFYRLLTSAVYAEAALIAPGNAYNQRWELRDGVGDAVIRTVYNGVDPEEFAVVDTEPAEPTLAWVGRIDPLKDLETLIRAFALVRERNPRARLRIFGGTPKGNEGYRASLMNLADHLRLRPALRFEGRVEMIQDAYAAGHVVVLTSISEGFPYTVIEAMSSGRATVSTDVGGVAEAVGDAGLVVPPRDPAAVADACLDLLADHDRRRRLGEAARQRVLGLFTLERCLSAFRSIYLDVRDGRVRPAVADLGDPAADTDPAGGSPGMEDVA